MAPYTIQLTQTFTDLTNDAAENADLLVRLHSEFLPVGPITTENTGYERRDLVIEILDNKSKESVKINRSN